MIIYDSEPDTIIIYGSVLGQSKKISCTESGMFYSILL